MITGNRVKITRNGSTASGYVLLGSDNRKSLAIELDEPMWLDGGLLCGPLILSMSEEGNYKELITGNQVELEWERHT
jgi:hypothetical protein